MRNTLRFLPALLLIGAAFFGQSLLRESARGLLQPLPVLGFALALGLSFHFNRSRLFFSALSFLLAYLLLVWLLPALGGGAQRQLFALIAFLLPLNLIVFSAIGERGMLNVRGLKRFAWLAAQALLLVWLLKAGSQGPGVYFQSVFVGGAAAAVSPIPQPALLVFGLGLGLFAATLLLRVTAEDIAFLGLLVLAVLALHYSEAPVLLRLLALSAGLLIAVAVVQESYSMAYIDELTALPGRRALQEQLNKLGGQYAIAMLDVDHFKKFNDTYGHDVGDQVLRRVAATMRTVRAGGKPFRYGGEEFSIIFPGKGRQEVIDALEAVREAIAEQPFDIRREGQRQKEKRGKRRVQGKKVQVTISIGVAEAGAGPGGPEGVMKAADQALYRAKKGGRNQVSQ